MAQEMVQVGCKLPAGIVLHLQEAGPNKLPRITAEVTLNGFSRSNKAGVIVPHQIVGGYGLTPVPKDFWDKWSKANKDFPPLKNDLIFMVPDIESAGAAAIEMSETKSGLEPLDPKKPAPNLEPLSKE